MNSLLTRLPFPLCQVYLRARNAKAQAERHNNAYYLLEASLRTAAALGAAKYLMESSPDPKVDRALEALAFPSVGQWVSILREISDFFGSRAQQADPSLCAWARSLGERTLDYPKCAELIRGMVECDGFDLRLSAKMSPMDLFNAMPPYRNKHLGHGAMASESFYQRFGALLLESAEEILEKVDPLAGGDLVFVEEKRDTGSGEVAVELIRLSGAMPLRMGLLKGPAASMEGWSPGKLYATWPGAGQTCLYPLIHGAYTEERAEVSFYNRRLGGVSTEYLNYATGALFKVNLAGKEFGFLAEAAMERKRGQAKPSPEKGPGEEKQEKSQKQARRSVAVLGFKNLIGNPDAAWLTTALSEMLTTELAAGGVLRTIPGENVTRMKVDLSLPEAESFSKETLETIRANLGCDYVVLGSYFLAGGGPDAQLRLDLRVQDTIAGATVGNITDTGTIPKFLEFVTKVGAALREEFGIVALTEDQSEQVKAAMPSGPDALKLYSEGIEKLRRYDAVGAREILEKLVSIDPRHSMAHSALSSAWAFLGYDERAREEARIAYELSETLSREDRRLTEGYFMEASREWKRATEIYGALFTLFPDDAEYGIRLSEVQVWAGKLREASETIASLRDLPAPACDDPRVDLLEAKLSHALSDPNAELENARQAAGKAEAIGALTLLARARFMESYALGQTGNLKEALDRAGRSRELFEKAGDLGGQAEATNAMALIRLRLGDLAETQKLLEEALKTFKVIGKRQGIASASSNLAVVLYNLGELGDAISRAREALEMYRALGNIKGEADALNNLGSFLIDSGDLGAARKVFEECLALFRNMGNKLGEANTLNNVSIIMIEDGFYDEAASRSCLAMGLFEIAGNTEGRGCSQINLGLAMLGKGDLAGAIAAETEAESAFRGSGQKAMLALALSYKGSALLLKGDIPAARASLEEAMSVGEEVGGEKALAQAQTSMSNLIMEEGSYTAAADLAGKAAETLRNIGAAEEELEALCTLAKAAAAARKLDMASASLLRARDLLSRVDRHHCRMMVAIAEARIRLGSDDLAAVKSGRDALDGSLRQSGGRIPVHLAYEARLTLTEMDIGLGRSKDAAADLDSLEKKATSVGYSLVAAKATSLRKSMTIEH